MRRLRRKELVPGWLVKDRRKLARKARKAHQDVLKAIKAPSNKLTPEQRLVQRTTSGMTLADLAEVSELGFKGFLDRQLHPESIDDGGFEDALLTNFRSLEMTPFELNNRFGNDPTRPIIELIIASLLRAAYSPRQLFERMVMFWSDHFSIDILANHAYILKMPDDREVARTHALGNFRELVSASAHSPAMLEYLTNDTNVKDHPNENYARELMELHTMGVNGGYTQKDVVEVARCFTGWTLNSPYNQLPSLGQFRFNDSVHDKGKKRVLGHKIKSGQGEADGLEVIRILAEHRSTSFFIARKLLRFFQSYEPSNRQVSRVAAKFRNSNGNLRATMKTVLAKKNMKKASPKLKRPQHLAVSAIRALGAEVVDPGYLIEQLLLSGHLPFGWSPPDGYPDDENYWSGFILPRWNFASIMPDTEESGLQIADYFLDASLSPKRFAKRLDQSMLNSRMTKETRIGIEEFLKAGDMTPKRMREAVGIAIASPEFQDY